MTTNQYKTGQVIVATHDAALPAGDLFTEDFWLDGEYAGGQSAVGEAAAKFESAVSAAEILLLEDSALRLVSVYAVTWPSMSEVLVATIRHDELEVAQ